MSKICLLLAVIPFLFPAAANAQLKKPAPAATPGFNIASVPVSKADLGTFPYFKTLPNFTATDSTTHESNRTYFYDGKKFFTIDGKVSSQNLNINQSDKPIVSEFGCIQEFDKVITTLGGVKFFTGKMPDEALKTFAGADAVELGSATKTAVAPSAYYGVVEYVIKTADKEVWVQLQPYSLGSKFYTLLVVEKSTPLLSLNTNKNNLILTSLEKEKKAIVQLSFAPDSDTLLSESKDEILSIAGVYQAHPAWKLSIECYNAPVGKADYTLALTSKRAAAIRQQLLALGVKDASLTAKGMGDSRPLVSNDTEAGRITNTRIEITVQ